MVVQLAEVVEAEPGRDLYLMLTAFLHLEGNLPPVWRELFRASFRTGGDAAELRDLLEQFAESSPYNRRLN